MHCPSSIGSTQGFIPEVVLLADEVEVDTVEVLVVEVLDNVDEVIELVFAKVVVLVLILVELVVVEAVGLHATVEVKEIHNVVMEYSKYL